MPTLHLSRVLIAAALLLPCGRVAAESVLNVIPPGVTAASGAAHVDVRVVMPTLILLRVGSSNATGGGAVINTLNFNIGIVGGIPGGFLLPSNGNDQQSPWNSAPAILSAAQQIVNVSFYSNAANNRLNCSLGAWTGPTGALTSADIRVTASGGVPHPGATLGACASTTVPRLLNSGTWTFSLGANGSSTAWPSGTYTNIVTYTASTL